jgi:hypothetical protein
MEKELDRRKAAEGVKFQNPALKWGGASCFPYATLFVTPKPPLCPILCLVFFTIGSAALLRPVFISSTAL